MAFIKYTEQQKAKLMAFAISAGYPNKRGSKLYAANIVGIDRKTIRKWYKNVNIELLEKEVLELKDLLENELESVFEEMNKKRKEASYKDLATTLGIMSDKLILLNGGVNSRTETITHNWKEIIEQARIEGYKPEMEYKNKLELESGSE